MKIDLDANATYLPSESLRQVILDSWHRLGNPSSLHRGGQKARAAVEEAREKLRDLIHAGPRDQIVFTSGATEANAMVLASMAIPGAHVVTSTIEHPCILQPLEVAQTRGADVTFIPPTTQGEVSLASIDGHMRDTTRLVSIMAANNETGVMNDIRGIASAVHSVSGEQVVHTDAAQIVGKHSLSFKDLGVDCLTISGHKFGALTGVGALIIREGVNVTPFVLGGPQEGKLRGGTENVLGIISLGVAASAILEEGQKRWVAMQSARDSFEHALRGSLQGYEINGILASRLPNTSSVFIRDVRADDLVVAMDLAGIYVSAGAACSSGKPDPSHVLRAMGQSDDRVRSTVRVSFRADQSPEAGATAARKLIEIVERMRASSRT